MFRSARRREAFRRPFREERGGGILCRHVHSLLELKLDLHVRVDDTTLWWFLESSVIILMANNPDESLANFLFIHSYVVFSLVKTLGNERAQPVCTESDFHHQQQTSEGDMVNFYCCTVTGDICFSKKLNFCKDAYKFHNAPYY